jgi:hypothetical protein
MMYVEVFSCFRIHLIYPVATNREVETGSYLIFTRSCLNILFSIMPDCIHWKRLMTEINILTTHPDVQSYFHYDSSRNDKDLGSFKVRILVPAEFSFRSLILELLTYIYHPAIDDNISGSEFCNKCPHVYWSVGSRISRWLKHPVNVIDHNQIRLMECIL